MRAGSLFTGMGGFDLGLAACGVEVAWQVENDAACNRVLTHHWPKVTRYGDINEFWPTKRHSVDLICGGFPCQDVSIAGKRAGLAGSRSALWWEFHRIIGILEPRWVLIENVYGLLNSNSGRDFLTIINALDELGYGVAWRVLDSRYFGVPQRRRRVFVVGRAGKPCPPEIFLEPEGGSGHAQKGGEAGQEAARTLANGSNAHRYDGESENFVIYHNKGQDFDVREYHDVSPTVAERWGTGGGNVPFVIRMREGKPGGGKGPLIRQNQSLALATANDQTLITGLSLRHLTPLECLRLQGFPDDFLDIPGLSDAAKYRMLGNAVTVPVVQWCVERIMKKEGNHE